MFNITALSIMLKIIAFIIEISVLHAAVQEDLIDSLPGINFKLNFKQYSGYLQPDNTTFLHYWLVESQNEPSSDPVMLWLNGGPCCSSVNDLFTLTGPFRVTDYGETIFENVYGWNKMANVLYLETPATVGFSYSTDPNVTFNDDQTAEINFNALQLFFEKYPEYSTNDFIIAGFSYGGVYLPTLAMNLLNDTAMAQRFKGMIIGNGYLNNVTLTNTLPIFIYEHALLDEDFWNEMIENCCNGNPTSCNYYDILMKGTASQTCVDQVSTVINTPMEINLDVANIYRTCYLEDGSSSSILYKRLFRNVGANLLTKSMSGVSDLQKSLPDCAYSGVTIYLARKDVRDAIHIPEFLPTWSNCGNLCSEKYQVQYTDMTDQLKNVVNAKVPILLYNGDVDTICNVIGNQQFVSSLRLPKLNSTQPWLYLNDTIPTAGMITKYDMLDYVTIRGGGHLSPSDRPREMLQLIANFLWKKDYSSATNLNLSPQPLLSGSYRTYTCGIIEIISTAVIVAIIKFRFPA